MSVKSQLACLLILLAATTFAAAGETVLIADAVERHDSAAIRRLLNGRADVNATQPDGMTALHWATWHDDTDTVKQLLAAGADAKAANRYGVTPLALACTSGNTAVVQILLDAGADAKAALPGGETMLMTAARTGRLGPVKALLAMGVDVNAREAKGQTALMWAAAEGHIDVVDELLKAEADFRTPLPSGFTPLFFAVREGRSDVVFRLLNAGCDINEPMRPERRFGSARGRATNPLLLAVENGHFELASSLLNAGADPNAHPAGFTALHAMSWVRKPIRGDGDPPPIGSGRMSSLEMVRQLVAYKADINARLEKGDGGRGKFTTSGSTPFVMAARTCDVPLMRLLLELGADPNLANADSCTPLLAASGVGALGDGDEAAGTEEEAVEACRLLLDLGADVNAVDKNGETAMHGAMYQDRWQLVQLFDSRGADIKVWNTTNKWGWTPLMIAQGHRPGNFRPEPDSIPIIEAAMRAKGVTPPPPVPREVRTWTP